MSEGPRARLPIGLEPTEVSERELPLGLDATEVSARDPSLDGGRASAPRVTGGDATLIGVGPPSNPTSPGAGTAVGELLPGEQVGRYVIERKVGAGGMGEVYAAHDPQLDRRVAIKVLRPSGRSGDAAARLLREAQALAKLAHPNVVAVHDVGEAEGRVFLAMQFVEGTTLGDHLARSKLTPDQIVTLYVAAGRGLEAAHAAGLVHRDMKPSNVLIDRAGHVAVTDFGVARASDDASTPDPGRSWTSPGASGSGRSALASDMTQAGAVIGTPSYMAPEQHAGKRATAKSDQFGFCVSLWQGLFHKHPFVPYDHDETTTAFEYMALISEGVLIAPRGNRTPAGDPVPRRVLAALTRGLAKDPAARWPSMTALLAELEPPTRTRAVVIGLAAVATAGAAAALWFGLHGRAAAGPSCATSAGERAATAWSRQRAAAIAAEFGKSGRPYAEAASKATAAALDQYAQRWRALAADACAGDAVPGADRGGAALAAARGQCLDRSLAALRSTATLLAETARPELVDNALTVVSGLPALEACTDPQALLAGGAPAPDQAATIAALEDRFTAARAQLDGGMFKEAGAALEALLGDVDAAGWPSLQVRTRIAIGDMRNSNLQGDPTLVDEAARIATEHGLTREAVGAWTLAMVTAGMARQGEAVEAYAKIAGALAAATHDPAMINRVRFMHGRALTRVRRMAEAEVTCRAALADARSRPDATWRERSQARDCLLEALVPAGKWDEAAALAREGMDEVSRQISPEHPSISDYLSVIARMKRAHGQLAEAKADFEKVHEQRVRAFGPRHLKVVETMQDLAPFERDLDKRKAYLEEALAIADDPDHASPRTGFVTYTLEAALGEIASRQDDPIAMQRHFDRAVAIAETTAGKDSVDVGMLLIGYGQFISAVDLTQSIAKLQRAADLLDALHDRRAEIARGALALMLINAERYAEARPVLERSLAAVDEKNTEPFNLAMMRFSLAQALAETHGDLARARTLATQARDGFLASEHPDNAKPVVAWLAKHRRR